MIHVKDLKKYYGTQPVLDGVSAQVQKGEVVAVLGASGSGKSTLLRCIHFLETPSSGEIWIQGEHLHSEGQTSIRSKLGMVFQNFNLFPHMTALENLTYAPCRVKGLPFPEVKEKALRLLTQVGLASKAESYPKSLSGGEKQRVAIARALMMDPEILLLDEPTSALDPAMVQEVLKVIQELAAQHMTLMIVTHEMHFVKNVATRVMFLEKGKILEDMPTQIFFNSHQNDRIAAFLAQE